MGTYADLLRELADKLDEDFTKNKDEVGEELKRIIKLWRRKKK